jgi:catechol-2,3-dioxygenase
MQACTTVIVTDQLEKVRDFYQTHFLQYPHASETPDSFSLRPNADAHLLWLAGSEEMTLSFGVTVRIHVPYPEMERAQLEAGGVDCSEMQSADWGIKHGVAQFFTFVDPSGTKITLYQDRVGTQSQLMTTGDGRGTKEVHGSPR